jgi:hypothetical protein
MFKLPDGIPNVRSSPQDWADYAEYISIYRSKTSLLDILKSPMMVSDEEIVSGIEDDTDRFINKADEVAAEINYRIKSTRGRYPFRLEDQDYTIVYVDKTSMHGLVYIFLLMATCLKMSNEKTQNGIDGTQIFERLSAEISIAFFGENAEADILGTSKSLKGGFRAKLANIFKRIGEGGTIHINPRHHPQDDNVDIIVWKGFSDKLPSQMIAFGQCKTGTSWSGSLSELNTDAFCKVWFTRQPILTPVRLFFCAQYFPRDIWHVRAYEAGLVFDRFRIIDYIPHNLSESLIQEIKTWNRAALKRFNQAS